MCVCLFNARAKKSKINFFLQEKGLNAFLKRRKVCGDNQIYCSHCTKKQDAVFVSFHQIQVCLFNS